MPVRGDAGEVRGVSEEVTSNCGPRLISQCRELRTFLNKQDDTMNNYAREWALAGGQPCLAGEKRATYEKENGWHGCQPFLLQVVGGI